MDRRNFFWLADRQSFNIFTTQMHILIHSVCTVYSYIQKKKKFFLVMLFAWTKDFWKMNREGRTDRFFLLESISIDWSRSVDQQWDSVHRRNFVREPRLTAGTKAVLCSYWWFQTNALYSTDHSSNIATFQQFQ